MSEPTLLSTGLLDRLEELWRGQRLPVLDRLRPGLADGQIDEMAAELGLRLPAEAKTLWGWHDGADAEDDPTSAIGPGRIFLGLERALDICRERRELASNILGEDDVGAAPDDPDGLWNPAWCPVLAESWVAVIDCSGPPQKPAPVWAIDWAGDYCKLVARSMGEMVQFWIEAFETGAWAFRPHDMKWDYRPERRPAERYPLV